MRLLKVISIAGITGLIVGLTIGFVYFTFFSPAEFPVIEVIAKLDKTEYQIDEKIYLKPYVINKGNRPIRVSAHGSLLFRKVYDVNNKEVPISQPLRVDVGSFHTLRPYHPYNESQPPFRFPGYLETKAFTLYPSGSYKVVVWAELSFVGENLAPLHTYYAKPIWIKVVDGSD